MNTNYQGYNAASFGDSQMGQGTAPNYRNTPEGGGQLGSSYGNAQGAGPEAGPSYNNTQGMAGPSFPNTPHIGYAGPSLTHQQDLHLDNPAARNMISNISLDDLLKYHPGVRNLDNLLKSVTRGMVTATNTNSQLFSKVTNLEQEIQELKVRPPGPLHFPHASSFRTTSSRSRTPSHLSSSFVRESGSVGPSDSASVPLDTYSLMQSRPRAADRPSEYPVTVLWTIADAKVDPKVAPKISGNQSRMPVPLCIRNADGSPISDPVWNSIKASTHLVIASVLDPLGSTANAEGEGDAQATERRGKKWYTQNHKAAWLAAVQQLEEQQPILCLCAVPWKAEAVLQKLIKNDNSAKSIRDTRAKRKAEAEAKAAGGSIKSSSGELSKSTQNSEPEESPPQTVISTATSGSRPDKRRRDSGTSHTGEPPHKKAKSPTSSTVGTVVSSAASKSVPVGFALGRLNNIPVIPASGDLAGAANRDIDTNFIVVSPSLDDLKDVLLREFGQISSSGPLFEAMSTCSDVGSKEPSAKVLQFIERIKGADYNDPTIDDDEKGVSWGHHQFTAGSMTCASVLSSWSDIGDTAVACRLIAAAVCTSKVAKYVCERKGLVGGAFISDDYLEKVVDLLWQHWQEAHTTSAAAPTASTSETLPREAESIAGSSAAGDTARELVSVPQPLPSELESQAHDRDILHNLQLHELKAWAQTNNIMAGGKKKKEDYINAILASSGPKPTDDDLDSLVRLRNSRKHKRKAL